MSRIHIHLSVDDLDRSTRFYTALFGAEPSVQKSDYVKWMLAEPKVNLAITAHENRPRGVDHLGVQADSAEELSALEGRLAAADIATAPEPSAECCYASSNKSWSTDPDGTIWEAFHTMGSIETYGHVDPQTAPKENDTSTVARACCG